MIPSAIFGALLMLASFVLVAKICNRMDDDDDDNFPNYPHGYL